jgi:pyrroline-5-carboxylate reductase
VAVEYPIMSSVQSSSTRIGFLGAGQMATALARGFLKAGLVTADQIVAVDVFAAAADRFRQETGGKTLSTPSEVAQQSDVLFLAVKPQHMSDVLSALSTSLESRHLVVSIAAGVTLATLSAGLGASCRIVRVMPNTPCLIGVGASAFSRGGAATADDAAVVAQLLSAVGLAVELPEKHLDAITGLSGSGPAFAYVMIEALSDGGVRMGLPRQLATDFAAQTLAGAAQMVLATGKHPGELKDAVASPGGTTIAGLHALEQGGLRGTLMNAVQAATERARELSQQ